MLASSAKLAYFQATRGCLGIIQKMKCQHGSKMYAPTKLLQATKLNCSHWEEVLYHSRVLAKHKADPKGLIKQSISKEEYTEWWAQVRTNMGRWHPGTSQGRKSITTQNGKWREQPLWAREWWLRSMSTRPRAKEGSLCPHSSPARTDQGNKHRNSLCSGSPLMLFPNVAGPTWTPGGKEAQGMGPEWAASYRERRQKGEHGFQWKREQAAQVISLNQNGLFHKQISTSISI